MDPELNFETHIENTLKKARAMSGMIVRGISHKSKDIMIPLYKALVRPVIEYGNAVWCPFKRKLIDKIEKVQQHFTRCIIGMGGLSYSERLEALGLPSLEFRRVRGDIIEVYKILNNIYDPVTTSSLLTLADNSVTRAHSFKLLKPRVTTKHYQSFFSNRVINLWNSLPDFVVSSESVNMLKYHVDLILDEYKYCVNFEISIPN